VLLSAVVPVRVWGWGFRVQGFGYRVSGFMFGVQGLRFKVQGLGLFCFTWEVGGRMLFVRVSGF